MVHLFQQFIGSFHDDAVVGGDTDAPQWTIPWSIPGSATGPISRGNLTIAGVFFRGIGYYQFQFLGQQRPEFSGDVEIITSGPDRNLCGSLTYRDAYSDWSAGSGRAPSSIHMTYATGLRTVDVGGIPRQRYQIWADTSDGSFGTFNTAVFSTSESAADYKEWKSPDTGDGPPYLSSYGTIRYTNLVTREWLRDVAAGWLALSQELKQQTTGANAGTGGTFVAGDGFDRGGATLSESATGYHAAASVIAAWTDVDLRQDRRTTDEFPVTHHLSTTQENPATGEILVHGYPDRFQVVVPTTTRKNFPRLIDHENQSLYNGTGIIDGLAIFNSGTASVTLKDPITGQKWKDESGIFAPTDPTWADDVGWKPEPAGPAFGSAATAFATLLQFVAADGADYRISLILHCREWTGVSGSEAGTLREIPLSNLLLTAAAPLTVDSINLPAGRERWEYTHLAYTAIQRKPAGSTAENYVTYRPPGITEGYPPGTPELKVSADPTFKPHLLLLYKQRIGQLWGFPVFSPYQTSDARRFRKKSYTQNWAIETTPAESDPPTDPWLSSLPGGPASPDIPDTPGSPDTHALPPGPSLLPQDNPLPTERYLLPQEKPPIPPQQRALPPQKSPIPPAKSVLPDESPVFDYQPSIFA